MIDTPFAVFHQVSDPRRQGGHLLHSLSDMIFLVISGVVCGANDWMKIEEFGKSQLGWLREYIPLKNGIPSHDVLGEVFASLDHQEFALCFVRWTQRVASLTAGQVVAIDGKRACGSYDRALGKAAIHLVSAFATANQLTLGQVKTDTKSNEITAIPELLRLLSLKGCLVTIDAMGCQKPIAEQIISQEADYVLALKGNQNNLYEQTVQLFDVLSVADTDAQQDLGHGRIEKRKCEIVTDLALIDAAREWQGIKSIVRITAERTDKLTGQQQTEQRFYIASIANAQQINQAVRTHWTIENSLHWILDVQFGEDASRRRKGNSAENFSLVSKVALGMIKQETSLKGGTNTKRLKAAWDIRYRNKILQI